MTSMISHVAGMDAEVSYAFHSERKRNPEKFRNQLTNQVIFIFHMFVGSVSLLIFSLLIKSNAQPILFKLC